MSHSDTRIELPLKEYNMLQRQLVKSAENVEATRRDFNLDRDPTNNECFTHWVETGGQQAFNNAYREKIEEPAVSFAPQTVAA